MRYYKYISQRNGDNSAYPIGMNYYMWSPGSNTWNSFRSATSGSWRNEVSGQNAELITIIAGDSIRTEGTYSELRNLFYSREENDYHVSLVPSTSMFNLSESQANCCLGANGLTFSYAPQSLTDHMAGDLRLYQSYDYGQRTDRLTNERFEVSYVEKQSFQHIHIYRRALLYLRFAEALNGAGFPRAAFSILSTGLNNGIYEEAVYPYCSESDSIWISQLDFPVTRYGIVTALDITTTGTIADNHNTMGLHSRGSGYTAANASYTFLEDSTLIAQRPTASPSEPWPPLTTRLPTSCLSWRTARSSPPTTT